MRSFSRFVAVAAAAVAGSLMLGVDSTEAASPINTTFDVEIEIVNDCKLLSATNLTFPDTGFLDVNVTQTSTINVTCTNTSPYEIALDDGTTAGGSVAVRKMTDGAQTIDYQLCRNDFTCADNWGETTGPGGDTEAGVGTGANVPHTVYGVVPAQTTPNPGIYTDQIGVEVTF